MESLLAIDWKSIFAPQGSLLEPVVRGTVMYIAMFALLRIFRRQAGSLSIADLLLLVIIADAAQNGMAGEARSVTEALILISTIVFWDYTFDWLGWKSKLMSRLLEPQPLLLVKNGRVNERNLRKELITNEELMSQLRQQGVEDIAEVEQCMLESNGEFSIILKSGKPAKRSNSKKVGGVD